MTISSRRTEPRQMLLKSLWLFSVLPFRLTRNGNSRADEMALLRLIRARSIGGMRNEKSPWRERQGLDYFNLRNRAPESPSRAGRLGLSSISALTPHPAELRVAGTGRSLVLLAHLSDLVALNRFALSFDIDLVNPRRVQPEDLGFDFGGEFLVAEFFCHFVADLEASEAFDLRLRAAAPDRVRSPNDMVFAPGQIQHLAEEMHRGQISSAHAAR